jgi:hypothetical protein
MSEEDATSEGDATGQPPAQRVAPRVLEALVCPMTGLRLAYDRERQELVSKSAGLAFPIRSGIPIMLVEEARKLDE